MHKLLRAIIGHTGAESDLGFVNPIGVDQSKDDIGCMCTGTRTSVMTEIDCGNIISKQGNVVMNKKNLGKSPKHQPSG